MEIDRLAQIGLRQSCRGRMKRPAAAMKRPAAAPKATAAKRARGQKVVEETPAEKGDARKGPAAKKAAKAKAKAKAKPRTTRSSKPKAKAKAKAGAATTTAKAGHSDGRKQRGDGPKATFARRTQAAKDPMKTFWQALRTAFETIVQNKVTSPSSLEDRTMDFFWETSLECFFAGPFLEVLPASLELCLSS